MQLLCESVGVQFGSRSQPVPVLRDLSFAVGEGEFLTFLGPSGCGKTTLLRVLANLIEPQLGKVTRLPSPGDRNGHVRLVFQENSVFPWMTVLDNAAFGLEMAGVPKADREAQARELLARYHLAEFAHVYPRHLSTGMKQRVAVIRAFLSNPSLLLMDEPFAAVDSQTRFRLQMELLLLWEQQRTTIVFVTHDLDEAILLSDRIIVLTNRPSGIAAEHPVRLPRQDRAAMVGGPEFLDLRRQLSRDLGLPAWDIQHA
ncbi:MAG: ABC transporter ATP-binding protein [Bryobacterales bacterium]|nr:ABC transporter ATP-binding protein [Bryobacterales bacterium]